MPSARCYCWSSVESAFLIHLYSTGYMSHEKDYRRFFLYLNLFMTMMLTLVLADNLLVLFVGWEGVGLCSYLLIGFFYDKPFDARTGLSCADAGRKAFIVNRIGDFAFLIGMLYLAIQFGTLRFSECRRRRWPRWQKPFRDDADGGRCSAVHRSLRQVGPDTAYTSGCPTPWRARRRSRH